MNTEPAALRHLDVPSRLRTVKRHAPKSLKRLARFLSRSYAQGTAHHRVLPDFLILGTKRGGTTSLWNWLLRHPYVAPLFPAAQQLKSPHFFDIHHQRGVSWYRSHFATTSTLEATSQRTGVRPLCGEASPYYMFHPLAPARVREILPEAKLLICLRNPVDRAYSHYWERRGGGFEPLSTFEEAIQAEPERLAETTTIVNAGEYSASHDNFSYLARGRYAEHLQQWLELFDRDQLHFIIFEELKNDEAGEYRKVQQFLGLPHVDLPPAPPRYNRLPAPPMDPATRKNLEAYFRPHNRTVAKAIGRPVPWPC